MFVENITISKNIGIGPKTLEVLKNSGIRTVFDLVNIFPTRYVDFKLTPLFEGDVFVKGIILNDSKTTYVKKNLSYETIEVNIGEEIVKVIIFNRTFLHCKLVKDSTIYIEGKFENRKMQITASNIYFNIVENTITPIYNYENIASKVLNKIINEALSRYEEYFKEYIPKYLLEKHNILGILDAYRKIHNPTCDNDKNMALNRFKYEELLMFELKLEYLKKLNRLSNKKPKQMDLLKVKEFISHIPFELTSDQKTVTNEIYKDLLSNYPANRLIQGDVGSGKTVVSAIAMYAATLDNYEVCLMAPTEILAKQHYLNMLELFKYTDVRIELLTGSITGKKRTILLEKIKNHECDIIIGTHALFTDDIIYDNLGLVITDEQHRFGVEQRSALRKKGFNPDVLYLSATPIPRTLAISMFGDMDLSIIKTKPKSRIEIKTKVFPDDKIDLCFDFVKKELDKSNQAYIVAPLISESEKIDLHDVNSIYELIKEKLPNYSIGILHGKMKQNEKDLVMDDFVKGKIQILVSTTVIEVGIDNKNATVMMILNSERFGLSQLHQLRGRVGRGDKESYCFLVTNKQDEIRLKVIEQTTDGFKLAEEDLKLRGPGDFFGSKQSGLPSFKYANLVLDYNLLEEAKKDASYLVNMDKLDNYKELKEKIDYKINSIKD